MLPAYGCFVAICRRLQLTHCTGNVYDTSASADLNLSKVLLDQGLVWYSGEGDSEDPAVARGVF